MIAEHASWFDPAMGFYPEPSRLWLGLKLVCFAFTLWALFVATLPIYIKLLLLLYVALFFYKACVPKRATRGKVRVVYYRAGSWWLEDVAGRRVEAVLRPRTVLATSWMCLLFREVPSGAHRQLVIMPDSLPIDEMARLRRAVFAAKAEGE